MKNFQFGWWVTATKFSVISVLEENVRLHTYIYQYECVRIYNYHNWQIRIKKKVTKPHKYCSDSGNGAMPSTKMCVKGVDKITIQFNSGRLSTTMQERDSDQTAIQCSGRVLYAYVLLHSKDWQPFAENLGTFAT